MLCLGLGLTRARKGGPATLPPATPANLSAAPGNTEVTLDWDLSAGATGYRIYRDGSFVRAPGEGVNEVVETGLTNGTEYSYTVSATNAGGESAQSGAVTVTPDGPNIFAFDSRNISTGALATITDTSSGGHNLTQATVGNRPVNTANVINSQNAILFDGIDDFMQSSSFTPVAQITTLMLLLKSSAGATTQFVFDGGATNRQLGFINSDGGPSAYAGSFLQDNANHLGTNWKALTIEFNGASTKIWVDDYLVKSGASGSNSVDRITLGIANDLSSAPFSGYIAACKFYTGVRTDLQRETVRAEWASAFQYSAAIGGFAWLPVPQGQISGQDFRVLMPDSPTSGKAIFYCHGSGEDATSLLDTDKFDCTTALATSLRMAETNAHDKSWGNDDSLSDARALVAYLRDTYGITEVKIWAQSMGGILGLELLCNLSVSGVTCTDFLGTFAAYDLGNMHGGALSGDIDTAYGGNYAVNSVGHDPAAFAANLFNGKRLRLYASAGDTVVSKTSNTDALATKATGHASSVVVVTCSGEHGDPSHFAPAEYLTFFS